ncbi:unnamed protein product [Adineta steineri]|uniref:Uncharacterized protein n=1 Tax=Adineta steineri TaxID=433720 RepID=A0A815E4B3_9BILA|nr:unnamed protein product [Adineta steineri]CAF3636273.1 unnamed protein product [Adineta steineri]
MSNDELSPTISSMTKNSISRKYHILIDNHILERKINDELDNDIIPTIGINTSSKLPFLPTKSNVLSSTLETMQMKKNRKKSKGTITTSSSFKLERQTTNIPSKIRLPTLCTTPNNNEQKRKSEYQRRQIYALNNLMRELEQEKFREFFKPNDVTPVNTEEVVVSNTEDSTKPSSI